MQVESEPRGYAARPLVERSNLRATRHRWTIPAAVQGVGDAWITRGPAREHGVDPGRFLRIAHAHIDGRVGRAGRHVASGATTDNTDIDARPGIEVLRLVQGSDHRGKGEDRAGSGLG